MRKLLPFLLALLIAFPVFGADTKTTALTEDTAPTSDDLVTLVNDPASTKGDRKATIGNFTKGLTLANFPASANVVSLLGAADYAAFKTLLSLGTMAGETATNYVAKSLYDANTVLYATSDNTPAALTVGASTIVGRKSTGDIVALTGAEALAIAGAQASDADLTAIAALTCTENQIIKRNGSSAWACAADADSAGTPTAITVANEASDASSYPLFVTATTGDLGPKTNTNLSFDATTGILSAAGFTAAGADGSRRLVVTNNTAITPTASVDEFYPEANVWKVNQNGTESSVAIGPTGGQVSFTGPSVPRAYALPDAAATILYSGGALGTPSGGTLTNATGLPAAGVTGTAITKAQVFSNCTTVKALVATDDFPVAIFPYAITITASRLYHVGSTEVVGQFDECTGTSGTCTSLTTINADITASSASVWTADDGSMSNASIAANNGIWWHTTSVTGTNTFATMCFFYTVD